MQDTTPRYAPDHVIIASKMRLFPVRRTIAHPPGQAPKNCPIRADMTVLELQTEAGSRWFGFDRCYINSELRMVVEGFDSRDEVRRKWPVVPEDRRV